MRKALAICLVGALVVCLGFCVWDLLQADPAPGPVIPGVAAEVPQDQTPETPPEEEQKPEAPKAPLQVAPKSGEIRGIVMDRASEIAITNAKVTIELYVPRGERSYALVDKFKKVLDVDAEGRFRLDVPGGGWYRALAVAKGFAPSTRKKLRPGNDVRLTMHLGAGLQGVVYVKDTTEPLADVQVKGKPEAGGPAHVVKTDENGLFYLIDLPAGTFVLEFRHQDYVHLSNVEQAIAGGVSHQMKVELDPGKILKGSVVTKRDKYPIAEAVIKVGTKEVKTDEGGLFKMRGAPASSLSVEVTARGFMRHNRTLNLSGSRTEAEFEVELTEGAEVYGEVTDEKGKPIKGASVKLFNSYNNGRYMYVDSRYRHLKILTDKEGQYVLTGLSPGKWKTYAVGAMHSNYPDSFAKNLKITHAEERIRVDVVMSGGGFVEGAVKDTDGNPVVGARVRLHSESAWSWGSESNRKLAGTNNEGLFSFSGVAEGRYYLYVDAKGYSTAWKSGIEILGTSERRGIEITLHKGKKLEGIVLNKEDGEPIAGALVTVRSKGGEGKAVSGPLGTFTVASVPEGPYSVTATLAGWARFNKYRMDVDAEGILRVEISKQPFVQGTVLDDKTGKPIRRFQVMLLRKNDRRPQNRWAAASRWTSDKEGKFSIQAKADTYTLEIYAQGYVRYRKKDVKLEVDQEPEDLTIRLRSGGAIEGYVRGPGGKPLRSIQVYIKTTDKQEELYRRKGYSEYDGYFFIGDLDSGDHDLVVKGGGFPIWEREGIRVGGAYPTMVEADLENFTTLTLRAKWKRKGKGKGNVRNDPRINSFVMDGLGNRFYRSYRWNRRNMQITLEALEYQKITLESGGYNYRGSGYKVTTKRSIRLRNGRTSQVRDLRAGPYRVRAKAPGYPERIEYIRLDFSSNTHLDLTFEPPKKKPVQPAAATQR